MIRVGIGYDVHRLVKNRSLILGGVHIPFTYGLEGHSDADVLVHAIMDAILGALGKGDIGFYFPDHDAQYREASSLNLLEHVVKIMYSEGYMVQNLDAILIAQQPRLSPYISEITYNLANILTNDFRNINIKSTTTEGLGAIGRGEGIAAQAIVSLKTKRFK